MKTIGDKKDLVPFVVTSVDKHFSYGKWLIDKIKVDSFNDEDSNPTTIDWNENAIKTILDNVLGIPVSELKYIDLTFPHKYCHGVYLFSKDNTFEYIGKCSSRAVVDRVGGHLTPGPYDWFNILLQHIVVKNKVTEEQWDQKLKELYDNAFQMTIRFIPVLEHDSIGVIERQLIGFLKPNLQ